MSLVWRKIQRSNKKAAKYKFVCQLQELTIQCGRKWQPQKVSVAWVHRRRRYLTKDHQWEPSITDPYRGIIVWPVEESECLEIITTLYRDSRQETFDDKEWTFIVEGVSPRGKRKALAGLSLNLRLFVNELPGTQTELQLKLKPMCEHVQVATMKLILSCQMLKEGSALDDDMQSVASAMSVSQRKVDIADLSELDNISPGDSSHSVSALVANSTPPITPDDSRLKPLPSEIISVASEISETWKMVETPRSSLSSHSPSPAVPTPHAPARFVAPEMKQAIAVPSDKKEEEFKKVETPVSVIQPPKSQAVTDLPPTGTDLLSWCQAATRGYRGVNVVDFSKCWRNGLAFCALVHRFRPDLIGDFDSLRPDDIRGNCKKAFDAAAVLGVPKLIDPEEMVIMVVPDKIAVTSYVYNLRAAVTGDSIGRPAASVQRRSHTPWSSSTSHDEEPSGRKSTSESPPVSSRQKIPSIAKTPSPSPIEVQGSASNEKRTPLMTRNQLMNPFDSDGEEADSGTPQRQSKEKFDQEKRQSKESFDHGKPPSKESVDQGRPQSKESFDQGRPQSKGIIDEGRSQSKEESLTEADSKSSLSTLSSTLSNVQSPISNNKPVPQPIVQQGTRQSSVEDQIRPTVLVSRNTNRPGDRQDLKRRARLLLHQFQADDRKSSKETPVSPEDERRRQELKERARQLIEEAQRQPQNVLKISELISLANEELWPPRTNRPGQAPANSAPTTRQTTPEHRQYIAQPLVTKESLREALQQQQQGDDGAFDRFKRFGSMRTQELTQTINFLSSRFLYQKGIRSASVPKELSRVYNGSRNTSTEVQAAPKKTEEALEKDTRSRDQILAEIEQLTVRQRILDQNAADVEKRWRRAMQDGSGTELEQSLMNEYLGLLNERNLLTRRDMYLNILEKIRDHEERFQHVQHQLGQLMTIDDSEKTEVHKRQIDELMGKLIEIVNRRDELAQQLIEHEHGTQEAAELAEINHALPLAVDDQKNCVIQ